jgi:hypothetical protein
VNDIVFNILSVLVSAVVLPLIAWAGKALVDFINSKVKNESVKRVLCEATEAAQMSVEMVAQTYVDELKKQGKFDADAQQIAFDKALANAKSLITDEAKQIIAGAYNDFDKWLATALEAFVNVRK